MNTMGQFIRHVEMLLHITRYHFPEILKTRKTSLDNDPNNFYDCEKLPTDFCWNSAASLSILNFFLIWLTRICFRYQPSEWVFSHRQKRRAFTSTNIQILLFSSISTAAAEHSLLMMKKCYKQFFNSQSQFFVSLIEQLVCVSREEPLTFLCFIKGRICNDIWKVNV